MAAWISRTVVICDLWVNVGNIPSLNLKHPWEFFMVKHMVISKHFPICHDLVHHPTETSIYFHGWLWMYRFQDGLIHLACCASPPGFQRFLDFSFGFSRFLCPEILRYKTSRKVCKRNNYHSGWWFQNLFHFHPENWRRSPIADEHSFQIG